ncbi:aminoglycoside adenylyltransferase domain-containing protein [Mesorhizobium sp. M1329]|uniref:aminoglycoside adenylyltransferase domain-containing protein n=1 Tax=Mesorhizobium sp. M1329 TaxID=2957083 RepID=UPI00333BE80B
MKPASWRIPGSSAQAVGNGEFVTKEAAAEWAVPRNASQPADVVSFAREAYLGNAKDD